MITKIQSVLLTIGLTIPLGCGQLPKEEGATEDAASTSGSVTGSGASANETQALGSAEDVSDLKLAGAFALNLPAALTGDSGSSLRLTQQRKSREACQMGQTINEVTRSLEEVGNFFCHIEAEKEKIKFGTKTRIVFDGQEFAKMWIDNSQADRIRIGFCSQDEEGSNSQIIDVTGLSENGPIGSIINKGIYTQDHEGQSVEGSFHRSVDFDMTDLGIAIVEASDKHKQESDTFNRFTALKLLDEGISEAILAAKGTWGGGSFSERGKALFDGTLGAAIFENSGTHEEQEYTFSRKAFFNDDGNVVAESSSEAFAEGGDLYVSKSDLPDYLDASFAPTALDGWVKDGCKDYEVEVSLDPESEAHQACDGDRDENHTDCWSDDEFQEGEDL